MDDWGVIAELQNQNAVQNSFSYQSNFILPSVAENTEKLDNAPPKKTPQDYFKNNSQIDDDDDGKEDVEDVTTAELLLKKILRTQLLETTADIEIERQKDNSPLHSVKSFEQLPIPPNLLKGIYAMHFNYPSKIQEISLPKMLANPPVNMIAQAQSGTGKSASFLVASMARIDTNLCFPQVLILAPTYELALQIGTVAGQMAAHSPSLNLRYAVRNERIPRGESVTEHMIIGTPGRVFDWARKTRCFDIQKIKVFVLDEADVMISLQGHQDECIRIHEMLSKNCQMLLFSATYSAEVMDFAEQIIPDPIVIRVRREEQALENIHQYFIRCPSPDLKYDAICNIYGSISVGQTFIFCRTKRTAAWLGRKLSEDGHSVGYLSSDLTVQQRADVINSFRRGKEKVLITTNVLSRGIDVQQVTMVINFDLPVTVDGKPDCETYLHRIGRTGRFGKSGVAINLVSNERDEKFLKAFQDHFKKPIRKINAEDLDELEALDS